LHLKDEKDKRERLLQDEYLNRSVRQNTDKKFGAQVGGDDRVLLKKTGTEREQGKKTGTEQREQAKASGVIEIRRYSVAVGKKVLLKNVSLTVAKSEVFGVVGPSGSGKTTLLRAMAGTGPAGSGWIEVLGNKMPTRRVSGSIGYMAQADALYEDLTGKENLSFFAGLYGLTGRILRTRFQFVTHLVELERDLDKLVRNYSGGMKRRLSLAIALIHNPEILLLDEPTVGVDPVLRQAFWREFEDRKAAGGSLVITTHVMDDAKRCDRLAFIRWGRFIALGTPAELLAEFDSAEWTPGFSAFAVTVENQWQATLNHGPTEGRGSHRKGRIRQ